MRILPPGLQAVLNFLKEADIFQRLLRIQFLNGEAGVDDDLIAGLHIVHAVDADLPREGSGLGDGGLAVNFTDFHGDG